MRAAPRASTLTAGRKLLVGLVSVLLSFALAELVVRALYPADADGTARFQGAPLGPYHLPIHVVEAKVAEYLALSAPRTVYDPDLGWTYRAGYSSADGLYHYDDVISRAAPGASERSLTPAPGALRIALFGDSFTHGDSVPFAATWGAKLEVALRARGVAAEVLNFGVGGYGMDQAFLRWKKLGRPLAPALVIFGFQPENLGRNVNLIRPLYYQRTDLPFTKPRFLVEGNGLRLINVPAVPPEALPALLRNFASWELAPYERSLPPDDYAGGPALKSRVVALGLEVGQRRGGTGESERFEPAGEQGDLGLRILAAFAADVRASGARFLVLHLPRKIDIAARRGGRALPYAPLLQQIEERFSLADPVEALAKVAVAIPESALFADREGHYAEPGNEAVAEVLSARILADRAEP